MIGLAAVVLAGNSRIQESTIRRLATANERNASVLRSLPVGVYRITAEGRILESNKRFAETLGFRDADELKRSSRNLNDFYTNKADRAKQVEKLREAPAFAEFELRRIDDRTIWVRDYPQATLNADGSIAYIDGVCVEMHGIDAIMRDIAEHRKLQSMKEHFIIAVTHELRTPLVSIKGYLDHIIAKEPNLSGDLKTKIEIVNRNADRLLHLTDDLLKLQDSETGRLDLKVEPLSLHEIIAQCVEEIQPLVKGKGQRVELEIPEKLSKVSADPLRFTEMMINLLENASKFSPTEGTIRIQVEERDGATAISVTDNGIGIDSKDLERVFEPFAVIEKPGYFKGTGLGLSLTRKLVEAQGGKIWASSVGKGRGATFTFTLPKTEEKWIMAHG